MAMNDQIKNSQDKPIEETRYTKGDRIKHRTLLLIVYDLLILLGSAVILQFLSQNDIREVTPVSVLLQYAVLGFSIIVTRTCFHVYTQVWRFSDATSFIRLTFSDFVACFVYVLLSVPAQMIPGWRGATMLRIGTIVLVSLVGSSTIRHIYTWTFEHASTLSRYAKRGWLQKLFVGALSFFAGFDLAQEEADETISANNKIKIAIVGAGRVGVSLAEELLKNQRAVYYPVCFIDHDKAKTGRTIAGIPVIAPGKDNKFLLDNYKVQEVVFAVQKDAEQQKELYEHYRSMGYKVKAYTLPVGNSSANGKMQIRDFEAEELLFRQPMDYLNEKTVSYYTNKVVMVTGGGGSIGSELSRQIAKMNPKQLIILDIYENNAYDIQQEMRLMYGNKLNLSIEIASVRDKVQIEKVFDRYRPQIVLHAAAHKHVPLMEHNCSEAVKNNVFGTWNLVIAAEKYGVEKFVMISTDKAVNPTNVMGASKRMCEMIVLSRAAGSKTSFSCTRFGNVLGSNGSVIPLFKRQIANGGPVTLTDRRIIRYFMTIPEASQLVLTSGAMAKSGELFVLDMGKPVKIYDLAVNMIRLSGLEPEADIKIIETGLRPGEKLFEELLMKTEELDKTDNDMVFIERDVPCSREEIDAKLNILREALLTNDDDQIRLAMKKVVPTYHSPKHVNAKALADGTYSKEQSGKGSQETIGK